VQKKGPAGYADRSGHFATFAGFAPASAPRLAALVTLDDASGQYGNLAAAPVFSEIMSTALLRMQIPAPPPMKGLPLQYDQARYNRANQCHIPHGAELQQLVARRAYNAAHPTTTTTSTTSTTTAPKKHSTTTQPHHGTTTTAPATRTTTATTVARAKPPVTTTTIAGAKPAGIP
jgi:hypothetical protein